MQRIPPTSPLQFFLAAVRARNPLTRQLGRRISRQRLTYLSGKKMRRLVSAISLAPDGRQGCYVEAGVALGGTAILIASLRRGGGTLHLFDVFGLIPPPGPEDGPDAHARFAVIAEGKSTGIGGEAYYGYRTDLVGEVTQNLRSFGHDPDRDRIVFHPGTFEDRMHLTEPVVFAHIDCDWYDSVKTCIDRLFPRLVSGGVMLFDDYTSYSGCRKAVDQFLQGRDDVEILFQEPSFAIRKLGG